MNTSAPNKEASTKRGLWSKINDSPYPQLLFAICALMVVVVIGLLVAVVVTVFDNFDYNADVMFLPALYHDLVTGVPIRNWRIPAVAGFFPDMLVMFSILWLSAEDSLIAFVIYGVTIMLLLGVATIYLISSLIRLRWWNVFLVYAVLCLWTLILLIGHDGVYLLLFVLMPSCHAGVILAGILFLALTIRMFRNPMSRVLTAIWILLSGVSIASDPFFFVQFFAPVVFCMYLFRRRASFPEGPSLAKIVLLCVPSLALFIAIQAVARKLFYLGADFVGPMIVQITELKPLFRDVYKEIGPIIESNLLTMLLVITSVLSALVILVWIIWKTYKIKLNKISSTILSYRLKICFCMLVFLISMLVSMFFPILTNYTRRQTGLPRYFQPLYVYPAIIISIGLSLLLAEYTHKTIKAIVISVLFLGCVLGVVFRGSDMWPKHLCERPSLVEYLDKLNVDTGLTCGMGSYWLAKPTTILSQKSMHVDTIWYPWGIFPHISNLYWYSDPNQGYLKRLRKYEFIVPYDGLSERFITEKFGHPAKIYENPSISIRPVGGIFEGPVMRVMIYNRKSDIGFRNYLYIPMLILTKMPMPSRIQNPRNLQQYKLEGKVYNIQNCSVLSPGEYLKVEFNPPAEGDILEICAESNNIYEIEVQYTDGRKEKLQVPVQQGYGLSRRLLSLNNSEGNSQVSFIIIHPIAGEDKYVVGHVYVYKDNW